MNNSSKLYLLSVIFLLLSGFISLVFYSQTVAAQTKPLTFLEITTALTNIQNNRQGKSTTKSEAINLVISEVKNRGIDEIFSAEIETNLRKLGATDELIEVIEQNSPPFRIKTNKEYDTYIKRADKCFDKKGDVWIDFYNSVIADYTKAIELAPDYYLTYYKRGLCRSTLNGQSIVFPSLTTPIDFPSFINEAFIQSVTDFSKAIELNSKFANAYFERGKIYQRNSFKEKDKYFPVSDFTKVIELKPNFIEAYFKRGELYKEQGKFDLAIADFSKIINASPNSIDFIFLSSALNSRSHIYELNKEYDLALSDLDRLAKLYDKGANHIYLGRSIDIYILKEDYEGAIERSTYLIKQIDSNNNYANNYLLYNCYLGRGTAYYKKKSYDIAIDNFSNAIKINPKNSSAYNARGFAYLDKKELDLALNDFNKTIELEPLKHTYYINRGLFYESQKDYWKAIADYQQALKLVVNSKEAKASLARVENIVAQTELSKTLPESKVPLIKNSIGMEFVTVPKGSFMMGSNLVDNEKPIRKVTFEKEFLIGRFEVTQKEWKAVMGKSADKLNNIFEDSIGDNYPIVYINWNEAKTFIAKLNEKNDGLIYSLPTESEWEYACRAGTTTMFPFGDKINTDQANFFNYNFSDNPTIETPEKKINKLKRVGLYEPNAWGIYDMIGNASEWVEDIFKNNYDGLKKDGSANINQTAIHHVIRGGNWLTASIGSLRPTFREYQPVFFSSLSTGFRVVARKK